MNALDVSDELDTRPVAFLSCATVAGLPEAPDAIEGLDPADALTWTPNMRAVENVLRARGKRLVWDSESYTAVAV